MKLSMDNLPRATAATTSVAYAPARIDRDLDRLVNERICVSRPYYALENLQCHAGDLLQAEVTVQNTTSGESTVISASEAGRHLAILGSCALALNNPSPKRHYYLASRAFFKRAKDIVRISPETTQGRLIVQAEAIELDLARKTGKVETSMYTQARDLVCELQVSYSVLPQPLFQRVFSKKRVITEAGPANNPYARNAALYDVAEDGADLTARLGVIDPAGCVGHFADYPAMPIAILCSALLRLGGLHLCRSLQRPDARYAVRFADVRADSLAFAGEELFVRSRLIGANFSGFRIVTTASDASDKVYATVDLVYDAITGTA
jgi:3-hydroxymyristoyl/3-hydroxydecanoyl-(acyl carrier protein) dehydratase